MSDPHPLDRLVDDTRSYIQTRTRLLKLQVVAKGSEMSGALVAQLTFVFLWLTVSAFLSISLALYLGEYFGKTYYGFLCVAGIYLIVLTILYLNRERWIKKPVSNAIIRSTLKEDSHED